MSDEQKMKPCPVRELAIDAYCSGYEAGHHDTVEAVFYGDGKPQTHREIASDWLTENHEAQAAVDSLAHRPDPPDAVKAAVGRLGTLLIAGDAMAAASAAMPENPIATDCHQRLTDLRTILAHLGADHAE